MVVVVVGVHDVECLWVMVAVRGLLIVEHYMNLILVAINPFKVVTEGQGGSGR